jgi:hypothetical protein
LQWDVPMLITHWLPGQEELNTKYLIDKKLVMGGVYTFSAVEHELHTGKFKRELVNNKAKDAIIAATGLLEWIRKYVRV